MPGGLSLSLRFPTTKAPAGKNGGGGGGGAGRGRIENVGPLVGGNYRDRELTMGELVGERVRVVRTLVFEYRAHEK